MAEESAVAATATAAALFPARSAQRAPGCASRAAALRPRPEPDPGECGPATPARPRPGLGERAPRSLAVLARAPGAPAAATQRPPLSAPAHRVPSPAAPPPTGRPPGPASPPPLAGPGQKMVQKKTAELQGFHRSFKVRAGSAWGRPGLDHPSGRWRDAEPAPQDTRRGSCQLPTLRLELPQPGVHCRGRGWGARVAVSAAHSPISSTLGPVGSFFQKPQTGLGTPTYVSLADPSQACAGMVRRGEFSRPQSVPSAQGPLGSFLQEPRAGLRGVLPVGAPGCMSPAEPSRVCTAGDCQQATVRSPASWGLRGSAGSFLLEPQAGLQASPAPSWVVCRMGQWAGCPPSAAPPRHRRPQAISCRSRKFLRRPHGCGTGPPQF